MNAEQVMAWIGHQQSLLDASGIKDFELKFTSTEIYCSGMDPLKDTFVCGVGSTVDEAMKKLRTRIPLGRDAANELRDQAKELLRRASELERGGAS